MYIKNPVATWILARLFDEELPIPRKNLLKNLCQASFTSMNDDDFSRVMGELKEEKYIEFEKKERVEHLPLTEDIYDPNMPDYEPGEPPRTSTRFQNVTKIYEGYTITEKGIIGFRRDIVDEFTKIQPNIDKLAEFKIKKFTGIVYTIRTSSNLMKDVIKLCIDNAPLVLEFMNTATSELSKIGIHV